MLLKWHQGGDADEMCDLDYADPALQVLGNPKKELAQLRASTGGLELGAKNLATNGFTHTFVCFTGEVSRPGRVTRTR